MNACSPPGRGEGPLTPPRRELLWRSRTPAPLPGGARGWVGSSTTSYDEPRAVLRRTESADKSVALQTLRAGGRVSGPRVSVWSACVFSAAFPGQAAIQWLDKFMESLLSFLRMH